jgi:cytochrome c oxidase cbb3-type subunit III
MNSFFNIFVIVIVVGNIIGYTWLLFRMRKMPKNDVASGEKRHHTFDGIEEYNNPLPRWWMWLFILCNLFAVTYLALYPGLGKFPGLLGWTSAKQLQEQREQSDKRYGPVYAAYGNTPIPELAKDNRAMATAERLFINNCAACHGPNAQGAKGYPNLTTNVWLFGGTPEDIKNTIMNGRIGNMPPMAAAIGGESAVPAVANYVRKISGQSYDKTLADLGEPKFKTVCAACHGADGKGNKMIGAPDLTAGKWIFGGSLEEIEYTIRNGRSAQMPAHAEKLGKDKVHLLAAYIYHLANDHEPAPTPASK